MTTGSSLNRRLLLGSLAIGAAGAAVSARSGFALAQAPAAPAAPPPPPAFTLPALGYPYEALEPHIDTATMRVHHSGHHNAFIGNLNTLAGQWDGLRAANTEAILRDLSQVPEAQRTGVRNNLGGHWNHAYFWNLMTPGGANAPVGPLKAAIEGAFGSIANMVIAFNAAGMGRFGSGWAWLIVDKDGKLAIVNTPYQDTPLELGAKAVVIGCDVWEHAYYLKHQNRRGDYLRSWWSTVNWDKAAANFAKA
ncbi:MAG: superoxide dismutase [Bosea sp. (in: a-proteobacteria)]